ncbi:SpoIVB peptidase S55 domain-containing protein [Microlunatus flavus]|uniref:SpoIVB peptidase S55 n=1 Tax=Microlunatus flavus TaxID=1036181 RepID=A0A1H9IX31_9ACTN|nr:SpoIVB peptidase S55 domain-containing protein [Microlunatus flavus]SEQ79144.1 SpoIVB peptidase S55 [Microlunatus flavus]
MTSAGRARQRVGAVLGVAALGALALGQTAGPASAAPAAAPGECPATLSSAQATTGLVGQGLTVVKGRTPEPFRVEVLGVQPDGIAAGRDLVLIKVSDVPGGHVVDQGSGIWAGMSGSPVYVGGKLLGAVSYGFTSSPSPIGGLTPAADMAALLDLGGAKAKAVAPAATRAVTLSASTRRAVSARAGAAVPSSSLERLPSPFTVSGLSGARLKRLQKDMTKADLPMRVLAGGRAAAPSGAPTERPVPGGNFASVQSYGDVTSASFGTTTYVCGDQALAYGHPDSFAGPARYGANDADAVAIVQDDVFGSFKLANVGGSFGVVDSDRLSGVRANLTQTPTTTPITTTVRNADTGRSRTGTTGVVDRDLLPALTPYALLANFDPTFDEVGDGRVTEGWTVTGTRAGGKPFTVHRNNKWADQDDASISPALGLADAVYALAQTEEEHVSITSVTYDATVSTTFRQLRLSKLEVSTDGGKTWASKGSVRVKAGKKLTVRTTVKPYRSSKKIKTVTTVKVPKSAKGLPATLSVYGGASLDGQGLEDSSCLFDDSCDSDEDSSLSATIKSIESAPRNDDLLVALQAGSDDEGGSDGSDGSDGKGDTLTLASRDVRQTEVVTGARGLDVEIR